MVKAYHFVAFSNHSLETSMPDSVSLIQSSPQILGKFQRVVFSFSWFLVKSLINKTSRTSNDIAVNLERLSKLDKRNKKTSKKVDNNFMSETITSFLFFRFTVDFQLTHYSIFIVFHYFHTALMLFLWKKEYFCLKMLLFWKKEQKLGHPSTIKIFWKLLLCLYLRKKFQVSSINLTSF